MGTFGFSALNIPDTVIDKPDELCVPVCRFQGTLTAEQTEEYKHVVLCQEKVQIKRELFS